MEYFSLTFIPLFVAIDGLGILPVYISLTNGMTRREKRKLSVQATLTALVVCVVILLAGRLIFSALSIDVNDLRIGGGLILLILAIYDLLFSKEEQKPSGSSVGIVPIGIPLIAGPTAITTLLVLTDSYGWFPTMVSLFLNLGFVFLVFFFADYISRMMGKSGSLAFAKVANLFLAAIAVHMIRTGIIEIYKGFN